MCLTRVNLIVKPYRNHTEQIDIDFLVDSGTVYSLISPFGLTKIGIESYKEVNLYYQTVQLILYCIQ
ncbi:MAG: hypothetical protein HW421_3298 [Ignavibacteria bacterium]|nr:hypothetical protein [Ignavibacteria bacterium]